MIRAKRRPHDVAVAGPVAHANAAHHGASRTARDLAAWNPRRMSVDAEILRDLDPLVARSRDMDRNSGIAASGFRTVADNVLGSGLRINPRPDYLALGKSKSWADGWAREVRSRWESYYWTTACHAGDSLTGDQITSQVFRAAMLNGEGVALPLWLPERGDGFSTKMQTVESDRLGNPPWLPETVAFRGGIEFDLYGMPVAYWIKGTHPGDSVVGADESLSRWERVPRKTPFGRLRVVHCFDSERSGQSRGKPLLSSVLPEFKNLDRYKQAELQAALVNSLIAAFITTPLGAEDIVELYGQDRAGMLKARQEHAVRLESGMIAALFPGDKVESFLPARPASAFDAFVTSVLRHIALAYDLPYEMLVKDWSRLNYVTARAALAEAWRSFLRRRDWLATSWMDPWYGLWLEEMVNAGEIDAPDFYARRAAYQRCRWIGPGRGTLDPVREAQAAQLRVDSRISTLEDECAELGRDWTEVLEQQATERARMAELGLPDHSAVRAANPIPPAQDSAPAGDGNGDGAQPGADPQDAGADPNTSGR